jgi:hypothetical protein
MIRAKIYGDVEGYESGLASMFPSQTVAGRTI